MYCIACGTPLAPGLSYCNRCGTSLKERTESTGLPIIAFLIAITLIGLCGLGIMLGGALALKNEANLPIELVGFFMLFTFLTIVITEISLVRQLSKLTGASRRKPVEQPSKFPQQFTAPNQLRPAQHLDEPVHSVTENTTRTLEYSRPTSKDTDPVVR